MTNQTKKFPFDLPEGVIAVEVKPGENIEAKLKEILDGIFGSEDKPNEHPATPIVKAYIEHIGGSMNTVENVLTRNVGDVKIMFKDRTWIRVMFMDLDNREHFNKTLKEFGSPNKCQGEIFVNGDFLAYFEVDQEDAARMAPRSVTH